MTTSRDSYAWIYRKLVTLLELSKVLAEDGFEPLTIEQVGKNFVTERNLAERMAKDARTSLLSIAIHNVVAFVITHRAC